MPRTGGTSRTVLRVLQFGFFPVRRTGLLGGLAFLPTCRRDERLLPIGDTPRPTRIRTPSNGRVRDVRTTVGSIGLTHRVLRQPMGCHGVTCTNRRPWPRRSRKSEEARWGQFMVSSFSRGPAEPVSPGTPVSKVQRHPARPRLPTTYQMLDRRRPPGHWCGRTHSGRGSRSLTDGAESAAVQRRVILCAGRLRDVWEPGGTPVACW